MKVHRLRPRTRGSAAVAELDPAGVSGMEEELSRTEAGSPPEDEALEEEETQHYVRPLGAAGMSFGAGTTGPASHAAPKGRAEHDATELTEHADPPASRGRIAGLAALGLAVAVASAVGAFAFFDGGPKAHVEPEAPRVRVAPVKADDGRRSLEVSGMSRPARHAELSFTIGGRVDERPVDIGDEVEAGQVLARLDPRPLENQLKAAQASVREVRAHLGRAYRDRRRTYDLSKAEVTSSAQLDEATSSVRALRAGRLQASAQLDEAKRMLEEATMRAPFAGTVSEVLIEPGEFATPGRPVIILSGGGGLEVEVEVPESEIHHIERGSSVEVDFPLAGKEGIEGSVKQVGRTTARVGRVFPVVVRLHEPEGVVPGMAAEVSFAIQRDRGLSVPVAAVINPGGQHPAVFRVVDGRVERVDVEVLELVDDRVTVVGGLEPDDRVVVGGHGGLVEGERVLVGNAPRGGSEPTGSEPTGPEPIGSRGS